MKEKSSSPQKNSVHIQVKPGRVDASGAAKASPMFREVTTPAKAVIVQGARSYSEFRKAFNAIAEKDARRAYLDQIDRAIAAKASDTSSWASLYEAADFLREHDEFWKELGFATFEDYWRDRAGEHFDNWRELEEAYNYGVVACPPLFKISWKEARQQAQQVARIRQIAAMSMGMNGSNQHVKRTHNGHYPTEDDARARVWEGGEWVDHGGNSFEYRVSKIKRDRPDVFDRMVAGDFFKSTQSGVVMIDLKAAEEAAGRNDPKPPRPKREMLGRARQLVSAAKNQLRGAPESQRVFIDELLNLPWFVRALKARGWRRDE